MEVLDDLAQTLGNRYGEARRGKVRGRASIATSRFMMGFPGHRPQPNCCASCKNGRFKTCVRLRHLSRLSLFGVLGLIQMRLQLVGGIW